jgi:hypothetical protein
MRSEEKMDFDTSQYAGGIRSGAAFGEQLTGGATRMRR